MAWSLMVTWTFPRVVGQVAPDAITAGVGPMLEPWIPMNSPGEMAEIDWAAVALPTALIDGVVSKLPLIVTLKASTVPTRLLLPLFSTARVQFPVDIFPL